MAEVEPVVTVVGPSMLMVPPPAATSPIAPSLVVVTAVVVVPLNVAVPSAAATTPLLPTPEVMKVSLVSVIVAPEPLTSAAAD